MESADVNWLVYKQALYTKQVIERELLTLYTRRWDTGSFSDSTYDEVTNACDALNAIMAYAYEETPIDPQYEAGMPQNVIDQLEGEGLL